MIGMSAMKNAQRSNRSTKDLRVILHRVLPVKITVRMAKSTITAGAAGAIGAASIGPAIQLWPKPAVCLPSEQRRRLAPSVCACKRAGG